MPTCSGRNGRWRRTRGCWHSIFTGAGTRWLGRRELNSSIRRCGTSGGDRRLQSRSRRACAAARRQGAPRKQSPRSSSRSCRAGSSSMRCSGSSRRCASPSRRRSCPAAAGPRERSIELPQRRPDLVALRLGYRSADADVRTAIIGQFPAFVARRLGTGHHQCPLRRSHRHFRPADLRPQSGAGRPDPCDAPAAARAVSGASRRCGRRREGLDAPDPRLTGDAATPARGRGGRGSRDRRSRLMRRAISINARSPTTRPPRSSGGSRRWRSSARSARRDHNDRRAGARIAADPYRPAREFEETMSRRSISSGRLSRLGALARAAPRPRRCAAIQLHRACSSH